MKPLNPIYAGVPTTIFEVMSQLAAEHGAINLGQGFPDVDGPEDLRRLAAESIEAGPNQYPPMPGLPALRRAVAEANRRFYGLDIDWREEVLVTSGATEAIADCLAALVSAGDEVVLIEPLYDCYLPLVQRAGGVARLVRVEPPDWRLPTDALAAAFGPRTKAILLNTPMNPAAKVFTAEELDLVAELVVAHDCYAIADEVYEHIVFGNHRHVSLMQRPGMGDRTLRIGSAGKTFSLTGWKVGYVTGATDLLAPVVKAHQFTTFATPPALQHAVAAGLAKGDDYYAGLAGDLSAKRDRLGDGLAAAGFGVVPCAGTYFITADFSPLGFAEDDVAFCRRMTIEAGVTAVPLSAFYQEAPPRSFVRFCFSKRDEVLDAAVQRLADWVSKADRAVA